MHTQTGRPTNSPFQFELWTIPNPSLPYSGTTPALVVSLEQNFGRSKREIPDGQEKFVLRDGQTCLLKRPGHKDVRFRVPVRRQPLAVAAPVQAVDVNDLDLPESVVA